MLHVIIIILIKNIIIKYFNEREKVNYVSPVRA